MSFDPSRPRPAHWSGACTTVLVWLWLSGELSGCVATPTATPATVPTAPAATSVTGPEPETRATPAAQYAEADAVRSLAAAIDERLTLMRDVAAAKWLSGAPILDSAREAVVLQDVAVQAQSLGLDPVTTQAFFAAQIRLARDLQQHWHDEWKRAERCAPCAESTNLQSVRERIDAIKARQFAALYLLAPVTDDIAAAMQPRVEATILRHALPPDDATAIMQSLLGVVRVPGGPVLARMQTTHVLRIATTGDYAPFSLDTNGRLTGADIELARQLAAHLGAAPVFLRTTWSSLTTDLRDGRFDVALSGIGYTPERAAAGLYSAAYHEGGKTLLARCADRARFDSPAKLDQPGVRVIVNPGGTNERFVRENVHRAQVIVQPDNRAVFAEIAAGRADVMVTDDVEAELQARRWHGQLCRTYAGTLTQGEKRILMAPDPALQALVNEWLAGASAAGVPARELERAMQAYVHDTAAP